MSVRVRDVVNNPERGEEMKKEKINFHLLNGVFFTLYSEQPWKSRLICNAVVKLQFLVRKAVRGVFLQNLRSLIDQQLRKHLNYDRVLTSGGGEELGAVGNNSYGSNWTTTLFVFIDSRVCR